MSQSDFNVANASGAAVRADINAHLDALASLSSGATAPSPTFPNQWWYDTSVSQLKRRNNANTAWFSAFLLDTIFDTNGNAINESEGTPVASAATTDIWATDGNTVHITGTTTITSFGTAPRVGAWRRVIFDGILTLTDGANLNLPGSANIPTEADDFAFVYAETTTLFKVLYFRASGKPVVGFSFSESFTSADQTITSAGQLTLAHSLSAAPELIQFRLKNTTADQDYSVGDEVIINPAGNDPAATLNRGLSIVVDATNIVIRFGSDVKPIAILNKLTGNGATVNVANWVLIVRAWA